MQYQDICRGDVQVAWLTRLWVRLPMESVKTFTYTLADKRSHSKRSCAAQYKATNVTNEHAWRGIQLNYVRKRTSVETLKITNFAETASHSPETPRQIPYAYTRRKEIIVKTEIQWKIVQSLNQIITRLLDPMRGDVNHPLRALEVSSA
jgi:hypothetical protein